MNETAKPGPHIGRYILIGFFTVAPLWVTWLVFDFLLGLLARTGEPLLRAAARGLRPLSETLADALANPALQYVLAVLFTLGTLYLIGLLTSFVLGRKLIAQLESILLRLPLVEQIYNATKKLLQSLRKPPVAGQRVVLIKFPSPEMRAVGFITKVMQEADTGRDLAVVYVPTSPNPTSGYIEILPLDAVVQTDWTMEEAMTFVVTGGTNAPANVRFDNPPAKARPASPETPA